MIEITPNPNDYGFAYNVYLSSLTQTNNAFLIPKLRQNNVTISQYLYIFEMKRLMGFLPDYIKNDIKLISDGK